jgi:hypothetical protein
MYWSLLLFHRQLVKLSGEVSPLFYTLPTRLFGLFGPFSLRLLPGLVFFPFLFPIFLFALPLLLCL